MNRATSATGWVRNPVMKSPELDPIQASSYELGWTFNPITGCLNNNNGLCKGGGFPCYAYKLANGRLKPLYLANDNFRPYKEKYDPMQLRDIAFYGDDPFYPRFWEERLRELQRGIDDPDYQRYIRQKPKGIFICDMGDLFGIGVPEQWTRKVLETIGDDSNSMHRFYLLTKQPQNLIKFSPFPENCWVGVTATNDEAYQAASFYLEQVEARVKYISFEPLLSPIDCRKSWDKRMDRLLNWLIIGACTGTHRDIEVLSAKYPELWGTILHGNKWALFPKIEWVRKIVEAADKAGIPVFLKDNLKSLFAPNYEVMYPWAYRLGEYRQELPIEQ